MQKMKTILLLIYVFSHAITACAFSSISSKSSVRIDAFLRATINDDNIEEEKELTPEIRSSYDDIEEVDVAIIGAGIGGLCAGAILNTLYNKKVGIYESHYLPGERIYVCFGCIHIICSI